MPFRNCHFTVLYYIRQNYGGILVKNIYNNWKKSENLLEKILKWFTFGRGGGFWKVNRRFTFLYFFSFWNLPLPNDHSVWIAAIGFDGSANKCESIINKKSLSYHKISQRHVCRIWDILHLWKGIKKLDGVAKLITDSPLKWFGKRTFISFKRRTPCFSCQ